MRSCRRVLPRRLPVDLDEAQVLLRDLGGRVLALDVPVEEALERVPPDRSADGEAGVAVDRSPLAQPVLDLGVVGAAAEDHADHAVAAVLAAGLGDAPAILLGVDPL